MSKETWVIDLSGCAEGMVWASSFLWFFVGIMTILAMWNTDVNLLPPDVPPNPTWAYIMVAVLAVAPMIYVFIVKQKR